MMYTAQDPFNPRELVLHGIQGRCCVAQALKWGPAPPAA